MQHTYGRQLQPRDERSIRRRMHRGAPSLLAPEIANHPADFSQVQHLSLRTAPMLLLAVCFATGILCRGWWQPAAEVVLDCALLLAAAAIACFRAPRIAWLATGFVWIALGWCAGALEPVQRPDALLPYADQLQRSITAQVSAVRHLDPQTPSSVSTAVRGGAADEENVFAALQPKRSAVESVDLDVDAIEEMTPDTDRMQPARGGARITVYTAPNAKADATPCGARVSLVVRLHRPQRYLDPGVFQYADLLAVRGIEVQGTAEAASLQVLDASHISMTCRLASAQQWSSARLVQLSRLPVWQHLPQPLRLTAADTAMLSAMLFGDRTHLTGDMRVAFERTGSFHLFVVAGMHVALLIGILHGALLRLRMKPATAAVITLAAATVYAFFTGFGEPVQRALLMSAVYLFTLQLGRGRNLLNAIGSAALVMLLLRPGALFESSFQMTVLAIVAIGGIAQPLWQRTLGGYLHALRNLERTSLDVMMQPRLAQFRVSLRWIGAALDSHRLLQRAPAMAVRLLLFVAELTLVGLCSEIVMALPMALYFHRATPFGIPANLLAVPLVGVLMMSAMATFIATLIHPLLAIVPAAATALLLHGVTLVIGTLSSLRGADIRLPPPLLASTVAAIACWFGLVYLLRLPVARGCRYACLLLPFSLPLVLWPRRPDIQPHTLEFTAIDVGQGDSLFVASPLGQTMLIDAGGPTGPASEAASATFDVGEQVVSPYLWTRGLRRLDVVTLTHAHTDHLGGMIAVLRAFRPRELWISVDADTPEFLALLREATIQGIRVRHLHSGDTVEWGGSDIRVLSPQPAYLPRREPVNDDSLVLRFAYGSSSVLAEGDAERTSENLIAAEALSPVTLLKVGHHGSNTSTTDALLNASHPRFAIISCGRGNRFGHPRLPVLQRLQNHGVLTARTDEMGAVQYLLKENGSVETNILNVQR